MNSMYLNVHMYICNRLPEIVSSILTLFLKSRLSTSNSTSITKNTNNAPHRPNNRCIPRHRRRHRPPRRFPRLEHRSQLPLQRLSRRRPRLENPRLGRPGHSPPRGHVKRSRRTASLRRTGEDLWPSTRRGSERRDHSPDNAAGRNVARASAECLRYECSRSVFVC